MAKAKANPNDLRDPWLVAVWPGMGSVALLAGSYLLEQLEPEQVLEFNARDFFETRSVDVANGLATATELPRSLFFEWKDPRGRRDLLIFIGEAQPTQGGYALCQRIVDYAVGRGAKRLFSFAALATQLNPGATPRVFAVATDRPSLAEVTRTGAEALTEGQISGLNGALLAAGAERGLRGTCLLGELPYFAAAVPNPRAAQVILEQFTHVADLEVDFTELEQRAQTVDHHLQQLLEQMGEEAGEAGEEQVEEAEHAAQPPSPPQPPDPSLDTGALRRIESLFERALRDRSSAFELKQELDRLGVFRRYEDRFLDLFRGAG